jgi:hypothetical protein
MRGWVSREKKKGKLSLKKAQYTSRYLLKCTLTERYSTSLTMCSWLMEQFKRKNKPKKRKDKMKLFWEMK